MLTCDICAAQGTELAVIGAPVKDAFVAFSTETGRKVRTRRCAGPLLGSWSR